MITCTLRNHPSTPCSAVEVLSVGVDLDTRVNTLRLSYHLSGDLEQIHIPEPQTPTAADGLWQHTCFEAFLAGDEASAYCEFNFSPSGQWAAYAFSAYRTRLNWAITNPPHCSFTQSGASAILCASIAINALPFTILPNKTLLLGLTAVIENNSSGFSYWASQHPGTQPDFHDSAGFNLVLPWQNLAGLASA